MNCKHMCPICLGKLKKSFPLMIDVSLNNENNKYSEKTPNLPKEKLYKGFKENLQSKFKKNFKIQLIQNKISKITVIFFCFIILTLLIFVFVNDDRKPLARLNWVPNTSNWWSNGLIHSGSECQKYESINSHFKEQIMTFEKKIAEMEKKLVDKHFIVDIINENLKKYDADKLGITDFALASAGAQIISTPNTNPWPKLTWLNTLTFWTEISTFQRPEVILEPGNNVGECWAFEGSHGNIIIELVGPVWIGAVTLEHISSSISIDGSINTAPREFNIKGFKNLMSCNGILLGEFEYLNNGMTRQTFLISEEKLDLGPFEFIELSITSNHGHPDYTCVYRLRVHGKLEN